ncbi:hypothetical protein AAE250_14355 [Bacteroides sp. GD17]|jgi:hypothetical protein|uniref:hypothetical protein n=1 Tax=Bacteroides sp. GD17 TaxID=3139826 RepID=UPI00313DD1AA
MANIIDITNQIGKEVKKTLNQDKCWLPFLRRENASLYFQETTLLYSLTENLLKYLVATKNCWDENCRLVDELDAKKANGEIVKEDDYYFDGNIIREQARDMTFNNAINKASSLGLISNELQATLHRIRKDRNDLIHQLYLFDKRSDANHMRKLLKEAESIVMELVPVFEKLIYDEIGVDTDEVLETLPLKQ